MASSYQTHVRVGAANAGHTVWVQGEKHVLQQLPCAAYANPWANLVLGAGALISPLILRAEIERNVAWRKQKALPPMRLYVDHRAHIVTDEHIEAEQGTDLAQRIGSTSTLAREGIGAAQAARVMRTGYAQVERLEWLPGYASVVDTAEMLHDAHLFGNAILLEGTQGTGLSNTTGQYPYVTSRNTSAAGLAADCGIGPRSVEGVIMVCRTFPIRVAGNSGPFWHDSHELSWQDVGIDPERERTTVTKKVRRVATFSYEQLHYAARVNSATEIALTFCDYLAPELREACGLMEARVLDRYDWVGPMVRQIERRAGVPVTLLGTGPTTVLEREPSIEPGTAGAETPMPSEPPRGVT